ncbi:hypothetical protein [Lactobacillus johnsonii]|uniref:Uncharacterized protein n=1 Tax=Lactobacillus johnsonii TaxID=33959 RepID=A0A9X0SD38_LACJH|nr:hypothetical protein [Lactobacillus johnsonii]KXN76903.1 hypothetical protein AYJ53_07505 [Lactobacillus johnsonii]
MKEFNEKHIKDLQEVGGFVLQDVFGHIVAIGIDSEYPDIASFLDDYIEIYGIYDLSKRLGYQNSRKMLNDLITKTIGFTFPITHIETKLMGAFKGISADDYAKKLEERQWHLGDVVEDGKGHKAMIIQDDHYFYELMKIKDEGAFQTFRYFDISADLTELQDDNPEWHKVVED